MSKDEAHEFLDSRPGWMQFTFLFHAVADTVGGLGREIEESLDGLTGLAPGPGLEKLSEEDEDGDHRRCLKVECDLAVLAEGLQIGSASCRERG